MNVLGAAIAVLAIVAVLVVLYLVGALRNRRTGSRGIVQRSRLTCPKCQRVFDYEWVPGAALTAVRLGKYRYMACPFCHRWANFNIYDAPAPLGIGGPPGQTPEP